MQLPPRRTLTATPLANHGVRVTISGSAMSSSHFELRQERRMPEPLDKRLDLGSSVGVETVPSGNGWRVFESQAVGMLTVLQLKPVGFDPAADPVLLAQLKAGRIVVEEIQDGLALRRPGPATRVVYTETFDRSAVGTTGVTS